MSLLTISYCFIKQKKCDTCIVITVLLATSAKSAGRHDKMAVEVRREISIYKTVG